MCNHCTDMPRLLMCEIHLSAFTDGARTLMRGRRPSVLGGMSRQHHAYEI